MEVTELAVEVRHEKKKGPSRRLRGRGVVPAVLYGRSMKNILLAVKRDELMRLYKDKKDHAFIKLIIDEGSGRKLEKLSLIKELQRHPLTGQFYHADFYEVDVKHKITMDVPLRFVGKAVGVENGGELQHMKRTVKVSCLPLNLPDHLDVEVSHLDIGDSVKVRDLKVPDGISLLDRPDTSLAAVAMIRVTKATEAAAEEAVAEEGVKAEETETPAETTSPKTEKGK